MYIIYYIIARIESPNVASYNIHYYKTQHYYIIIFIIYEFYYKFLLVLYRYREKH